MAEPTRRRRSTPLGIGDRVARIEDERLITGQGCFAGDVRLPGMLHAAFRRAEVPHADIRRVDTARAARMPGVVSILTAGDLPEQARFLYDRQLPPHLVSIGRPVLAHSTINHIGEAIALVVAEDAYAAHDAAVAIEVETDTLPAAGTVEAALAEGATPLHPGFESNVAWWGVDGFGDVEAAFSAGGVVVRDRFKTSRVSGAAMEPRAATAAPTEQGVTVWSSTQAVFRVRDMVANALGIDPSNVVVLASDVGGGFGPKSRRYPEDLLVALAAHRLGRPVTWVAGRSEDMAASVQAHGTVFDLELAARSDGTLLGLRGVLLQDIGAYPSIGVLTPSSMVRNMICAYRLPAFALEVNEVFTNTISTGTVRGGGATEGNFVVERMMDRLASRLSLDPCEVRRRNLFAPEELPYRIRLGATTVTVDTGHFTRLLDEATDLIGAATVAADGRLRGVGVAMGVENNISVFEAEPAEVRIGADGVAHVAVGSSPQGQSHRTFVRQVAASRLGWPLDRVTAVAGDTRLEARAGPTASSRSAVHLGNAVALAAREAASTIIREAARALEADPAGLELADGWIVSTATGRRWPATKFVPDAGIHVLKTWRGRATGTCPSSCHAAEVAVDPETGAVEVLRYVIVYDSGVLVNPAVVDGQLRGGLAHGIGYALLEAGDYRADGSQLAPTFREYLVPSVGEVPLDTSLRSRPTPSATNPEGIKGAGEIGTFAAPAAILSAIEAAIRTFAPGAELRDLPATADAILSELARLPARRGGGKG